MSEQCLVSDKVYPDHAWRIGKINNQPREYCQRCGQWKVDPAPSQSTERLKAQGGGAENGSSLLR